MKPYELKPFTNSVGQVINPGDSILVITGGRGASIHTRVGTYLGSRPYKTYWQKEPQTSVVIEVQDTATIWVDADGKPCGWKAGVDRKKITTTRKTSLTCNRIFKLA